MDSNQALPMNPYFKLHQDGVIYPLTQEIQISLAQVQALPPLRRQPRVVQQVPHQLHQAQQVQPHPPVDLPLLPLVQPLVQPLPVVHQPLIQPRPIRPVQQLPQEIQINPPNPHRQIHQPRVLPSLLHQAQPLQTEPFPFLQPTIKRNLTPLVQEHKQALGSEE